VFKIPVGGGLPVSLVKEYSIDPVWAPDGRFLLYSGPDVGTTFPLRAVSADGTPFPLRTLILTRSARHLAFLEEDMLIFLKGDISQKDFWSLDLKSGHESCMHLSPAALEAAIRLLETPVERGQLSCGEVMGAPVTVRAASPSLIADYSPRIALTGLTRAARIAGMAHASSAATSISTMTEA
jgi:hypothetical protein